MIKSIIIWLRPDNARMGTGNRDGVGGNAPACVLSPGRREMRRRPGRPPGRCFCRSQTAGRSPRIAVAPTSQCGSARPAGNGISCWPGTGRTLVWLRCARIIEKETQHFLRCARSLRIRVRAGRAASRPRVAGTVDRVSAPWSDRVTSPRQNW